MKIAAILLAVLLAVPAAAQEQNPDAEVELIKAKVAKHRNGPIGEVPLQFRKANTRFYTVAAREEIAAY